MGARRLAAPLALLACTWAGEPAFSADTTLALATPTAPPAVAEPLYAAPTRPDRTGRILVRVEVNGRGPYRFIIDTGANRSAISPRLLRELGLAAETGDAVDLHGVTGSAEMPSVAITSLKAGEIVLEPGRLPVLSQPVFSDADGILGVEGLQHARITVDFVDDRVEIVSGAGLRALRGYVKIPARIERGGLLIADGKVGRLPVRVVIDTGAERTLGNAALRDALIARASRGEIHLNTIVGATPDVAQGVSFLVPNMQIGAARLRNMPVTFADLHVFKVWGLEHEPALLIGMDLIGTLQRFVVDYERQEVHLQTREGQRRGTPVRHCGPGECQSRIPGADRL